MKHNRIIFATLIFFMTITVLANIWLTYDRTVISKTRLDIPLKCGDWRGNEITLSDSVMGMIQPDNYIFRTYVGQHGEKVDVYVGYYGGLAKSDFAHSPLVCYPGNGWEIKEVKQVTTQRTGNRLDFTRMLVKKELSSEMVYFAYQNADLLTPSMSRLKWDLSGRFLLGKRTDNVFMRFSIRTDPVDQQAAKKVMEEFIRDFYPHIERIFVS